MKETKTLRKEKRRENRVAFYLVIAVLFALLCAISTLGFLYLSQSAKLKLSVEDGETFVVEYGIGALPEVTASYRTTMYTKEDTFVDVSVKGHVDFNTIGTYHITYTASAEGQVVSATHTYIVEDNTPPVITLTGEATCYYSPGYTFTDPGFQATDNYDGDLTDQVVCTETPTSITYTVSDSFGNETSVVRTLICQDVVAPSITLNSGDALIIPKNSVFTDPGFVASDDVDGDLTASVETSGTIDSTIYGKQYLTYQVTDSSGNTTQIQRTVTVREYTPPTLSLTSDTAFVRAGEDFVESGYNAFDDIDGDVTANVSVSGTLDTLTPGIYTLTYTAIDSSRNTTSLNKTVYVYEPQSEERKANPTDKIVYLSFDDGPYQYTEQLLDILDKYNVDVTFFVTNQYPEYQHMIHDAYSRGHTIAIHTYTHNFAKVYASETAYFTDLMNMSALIEDQTGITPTILRFPGGTSNTVSRRYCRGIMTALTQSVTNRGYQYVDWNVDSNDAGGAKTSDEVVSNVITGMKKFPTSFVLQHDTKQFSVEAVEEILCWGLLNGYTFLPLTDTTEMYHHNPAN